MGTLVSLNEALLYFTFTTNLLIVPAITSKLWGTINVYQDPNTYKNQQYIL
jgi:hypothetical protein